MSVTDGTVLRIVAQMLWTDSEICQNVYNAVVTGGSSPYADSDIADDAEDWLDNMYANLTTSVTDNLDGNSVTVYKYDAVDDDWDEVFSQSWTWNPSNVTENLPRACAGLVRLWTSDPDVQGKKYIPGFTEGNVEDGLISAGLLTNMIAYGVDWWTPFVGAASGATFTPGVWSVAGTVFKAAVEHYAASAIVAYQRRRKNNVGI